MKSVKQKTTTRWFFSVRVGRIELPTDPWQGPVLPLNYTRIIWIVR